MNLSLSSHRKIPPSSIDRILLIHPFGIGDALFITPVIRSLKENGIKRIDLLLGSRTRDLFDTNPNVSWIYEWDRTKPKSILDRCRCAWRTSLLYLKIQRNRYQAVIDFSPNAKYALPCFAFFWIKFRIGFHYKGFYSLFLTHKMKIHRGYVRRSVVEYYLDLLQCFGLSTRDRRLGLFLTDGDREGCRGALKRIGIREDEILLAVAPGGGESWGKDARLKRWPVANFAQLIFRLKEESLIPFERVVILGGENEFALGDELEKLLGGQAVWNACGALSLRASAALIQEASCLIANDGGLVHVAGAVRTPVVAIYGPVDPDVYGPAADDRSALTIAKKGPACRPCYQEFRYQEACEGVECLRGLTVETVVGEIRKARFFGRLESANAKPVLRFETR